MQKLSNTVSIDNIIDLKAINYNIDKNVQSKYISHDFSLK